jgi:minor extracellular serine protease Vpr
VAGIIGGQSETFIGVAPAAQLGIYKVFPCETGPSTSTDLLLAAMQQAYEDGMDILNMSIGGAKAWSNTPVSLMAEELSRRGMIIVAAQGKQ